MEFVELPHGTAPELGSSQPVPCQEPHTYPRGHQVSSSPYTLNSSTEVFGFT